MRTGEEEAEEDEGESASEDEEEEEAEEDEEEEEQQQEQHRQKQQQMKQQQCLDCAAPVWKGVRYKRPGSGEEWICKRCAERCRQQQAGGGSGSRGRDQDESDCLQCGTRIGRGRRERHPATQAE